VLGIKLNSSDVSVLDYGADSTGVNDTSTAFNNALQYAKTQGTISEMMLNLILYRKV
jgi:hypothetical protein